MRKKEVLERARYIFTNGKILHDHIFQIHTRELAAIGRDSRHGEMSIAQMELIHLLSEQGEATISELAERLDVSPPSASVMVDRLVEKGVLIREQSRQDRRKVLVRISPEAVRTVEKIENAILKSFAELVEKLGADTTQKWCQVLERVREVLTPDPAGAGSQPVQGEVKENE